MNQIKLDRVYTNGTQDVVPFDIDLIRSTVVFDIISGERKGSSDICSTTTFKKNYTER